MREQRAKRRFESILAKSARARPAGRTVVLCYHSVHPSKRFASATPRLFEQHIEWLQEHCDIVPYDSIPRLTSSSNRGKPVVAITFDDGYEDNYTYALPTLLAHQIPATVFVTTGLIDRDPPIIRRFSRLWRASDDDVRGLSWTQVSEMREAGLEIGAHTHSHPNLFKIEEPKVLEEISNSRTKLEDHLKEPVRLFAYPFGKPRQHLSGRTIDLVASLGFESAATICYRGARSSDSPLSIPRFPVTKDSVQVLAAKVYGRLDVIGLWQERAPLWLSRLLSYDPSRWAGDDQLAGRPRWRVP
jgi:peptidoglycan/xylan/chitin deacetylase (PgdA/CDA1 family)